MGNEKKLVFVVEDNPVQQKQLQVHFEQTLGDFEVKIFPTPQALMNSLEEKPYAVVLDHFFEGQTKTGLDYIADIRRRYKNLPVIYHTTLDDEKVRMQVMDLGAEMYIIKDSASLVRLRTALDNIKEKESKRGFFSKLFGR
ncbi:MAG: response regulator [Cyclobacteriaceae bacterium]|nr:response regulator [Cyclobacteriaceae bacterium]